jgi:hypothetical protein
VVGAVQQADRPSFCVIGTSALEHLSAAVEQHAQPNAAMAWSFLRGAGSRRWLYMDVHALCHFLFRQAAFVAALTVQAS